MKQAESAGRRRIRRGRDRRMAPLPPAPPGGSKADLRRGRDRRRYGYISEVELFQGVDYDAVESVVARCRIRELEDGEILLAPGRTNHSLYVVLAGALRVQPAQDRDAGFEAIVPGECFGELTLVEGRPATDFVVAVGATQLLVLPEALVWSKLVPVPGVARNLMRALARRVRGAARG